MAFNDHPQVDRASVNDDRANSMLLLHFSREEGFIARPQSKDMGCDYKVELIEKGATNWSFDIQLKTVEKPRYISNRDFLSFSIETSRLGYLVRNKPIYGLLVVYDVGAGVFYFDLVDELYSRLLKERESEAWKLNDEVSVHVPCRNVLNKVALSAIHEKFLGRFHALGIMSGNHASSYGLPNPDMGLAGGGSIHSVDDAVSELRELGAMRMTQRDMRKVYGLLERLHRKLIVSDKELLLIAAVAYNQVGRLAESGYYIERLRKRFELNESECRMIDFIDLKNQMRLGNIDRRSFIEGIRLLMPGSGFLEELTLRFNILYFELGGLRVFEPMPPGLVSEFEALEEMICNVGDDMQRNYLKAWNLENLSLIVSHIRTEDLNRMAVFRQHGMEMEIGQRQRYGERSSKLYHMLDHGYMQVSGYAKKENDFVLLSIVVTSNIRFWLSFETDLLIFGDGGISREKSRVELDERIDIADGTFEVLLEFKLFRQAYLLRCMTLELLLISREWYGFEDRYDLEKIKNDISGLERDLEIAPFVSSLPSFIEKKKSEAGRGVSGLLGVIGLNDAQIRTYAQYILETGYYPNAKQENLVHEMMAFRDFHERKADERFELVILKPKDRALAYLLPSHFSIRDKKTGVESLPGIDLDGLLRAFGS